MLLNDNNNLIKKVTFFCDSKNTNMAGPPSSQSELSYEHTYIEFFYSCSPPPPPRASTLPSPLRAPIMIMIHSLYSVCLTLRELEKKSTKIKQKQKISGS